MGEENSRKNMEDRGIKNGRQFVFYNSKTPKWTDAEKQRRELALRRLKAVFSTFQNVTTRYQLLLQSWYQKTA